MLHLRPRNRFEDLDAVYLVGGGTHPGSGLPVIFESARITTRLLLEDLGIPTHWTMDDGHDERTDSHSLPLKSDSVVPGMRWPRKPSGLSSAGLRNR